MSGNTHELSLNEITRNLTGKLEKYSGRDIIGEILDRKLAERKRAPEFRFDILNSMKNAQTLGLSFREELRFKECFI